ncbi:indoleamine 2,3-dioxygenase [Aspergillus homomorphus CBS 101889]|uniref:Indoleamine 2,3-dioxygenase n=1 Tax=Aspergillus homomorphus (strain CBS 101889) TaxID=1450537 RepID=A0A395IAA4_ASPHC|nr:Indoleamine 2,3-dioxygenase [Aspergillus homomorphus CBS 101889]RAL16895.1 Indoleamine 2,3-dioxygenase [Aspergillus homomorphus CBS 101889]
MLQPLDIDLAAYQISTKCGFLPEEPPVARLNDSYYDPWECLLSDLPRLLVEGLAREEIDRLPVLSTKRLSSEPMWRRAYVILSFLAQAYIWERGIVRNTLPPSIVRPLLDVAQHLELKPCATFAAFCLWNFSVQRSDDEPGEISITQPENLPTISSLSNTQDESWFFSISNAIEARGGPIIFSLLTALRAVQLNNVSQLEQFLQEVSASLEEIRRTLERISERCEPWVFYDEVRPMLCGSRNVTSTGFPNGVFYVHGEVPTEGQWHAYSGASNAQSSTIQLFDVILGVQHEASANGAAVGESKMGYLQEMRHYMPGPHRRFLELMEERCTIRAFVLSQPPDSEVQKLYQIAVLELRALRDTHLSIVSRYVIIPAMRHKARRCSLGCTDLIGTGGTEMISFLKNSRDETDAASRLQ